MSKEDHAVLPESVRLENALMIWIRDMREEQLQLVRKGGRLSVSALAYEEVIKLRGILGRVMADRKRRIQGRWNRRAARRTAEFELQCALRGQSIVEVETRRERRARERQEFLLSREFQNLNIVDQLRRPHRGIARIWESTCTDDDCWCWGSEQHNPRS